MRHMPRTATEIAYVTGSPHSPGEPFKPFSIQRLPLQLIRKMGGILFSNRIVTPPDSFQSLIFCWSFFCPFDR